MASRFIWSFRLFVMPAETRLRTLIVDDEPLAVERLQILCAQIDAISLVGAASDGEAAIRLIAALSPDLVLLDIAMPGLDGMAVAQAIDGRARPPAIVFCTAFDEFAVAAFDVAAVDYLLKPVTPERLDKAVARVADKLRSGEPATTGSPAWIEEFWVPHRSEVIRLAATDVDRIEAERDYMRLHVGSRSFLLHLTIGGLTDQPARHIPARAQSNPRQGHRPDRDRRAGRSRLARAHGGKTPRQRHASRRRVHHRWKDDAMSALDFDPWAWMQANAELLPPEPALAALATLAVSPHPLTDIDLPEPWREGLSRLPSMIAPAHMTAATWERLKAAALSFVERWGAQAAALGWSEADLFGVNLEAGNRLDRDGLVVALDGRPVLAMTSEVASIAASNGNVLRHYRGVRTSAVAIWDVGQLYHEEGGE